MAMPAFWLGVALFAVTPRRSKVAYSESISPNNQAALPTRENDLLVKTNFLKYFNVIWVVQSPSAKIFRFSNTPNQWLFHAIPLPQEGRSRSSRASRAGRDGRGGVRDERTDANDEVAWSWRPDAGAKFLERATRALGATVAKEPGHRGEREVSRKTTRAGKAGVNPVEPVVLLPCFLLHGTHGCNRHPAFPAPSALKEGQNRRKARAYRAARMRTHISPLFDKFDLTIERGRMVPQEEGSPVDDPSWFTRRPPASEP
jgi:hypothetical protein